MSEIFSFLGANDERVELTTISPDKTARLVTVEPKMMHQDKYPVITENLVLQGVVRRNLLRSRLGASDIKVGDIIVLGGPDDSTIETVPVEQVFETGRIRKKS